MTIFIDEKPRGEATREALAKAIAELDAGEAQLVCLRRPDGDYLQATVEDDGSVFLELFRRGAHFGLSIDAEDLDEAEESFREFRDGLTPNLPWGRLKLPKLPMFEVVAGLAYHPDCPLCRAQKNGR
jgi:hypothetical protein